MPPFESRTGLPVRAPETSTTQLRRRESLAAGIFVAGCARIPQSSRSIVAHRLVLGDAQADGGTQNRRQSLKRRVQSSCRAQRTHEPLFQVLMIHAHE